VTTVVTCPSCGTENSPGRKFCGGCGAPLALTCPACGAANEPGMRFCGECGSPLTADAPAPAVAAPAAERRLVSVLFADLVGFTTLSESRDPEEVRELLSRYFDTARALIGRYGGTVEKFIGDAVMAVWGTPVATEDDAERAVRAGLDLVAAVAALGDEFGAPGLSARAGVLTGEAAVTLGAEGEGMVAGDLVNTASRIQSAADPGTVLVGEATRRASEAAIAYADAGTHELKGKAEPLPLWRASRVVSGRQGALKSGGLEAPFVGRDRELRQLKELFHACADERRPHLVSVTGIAGIGKSRLGWEFYKYFDGLADTVYWHRGRCLAYGDGVTYWALADMIRMRCLIAEDEDDATAAAKLRATVEEHLADPADREFVGPRLAQLLALGDQKPGDKQDLFAAWRLFFERLAETYPTVLVFEDLQWADASLLDFVEYLIEWSRGHPIFVLTLARPELAERRTGWGAGHRHFTSLYLEPLAPGAMEELLSGLVPGLPDEIRDQVLARAEGVPLYAVETVRMLIDRGALMQEGDVYRPVGPIESLDVPETLHALIAARLDALAPDERRLLQDASILGKTFTAEGIAAVSGTERPDALLHALVRKEILGLQSDPRSPEHGQYGFLQDLVRHVAYETLSRHERRARHLAAARYVEGVFPGEHEVAEVAAAHYRAAYDAAPDADDAAEVKASARDALVRAGDRADSLGAAGEAMRYLSGAARMTDDERTRADLCVRAGWIGHRTADFDASAALLEEASTLYQAVGDRRAAAHAQVRLAGIERRRGHVAEPLARIEAAFDVLVGVDDEFLAEAAFVRAAALTFSGANDEARKYVDIALGIAEPRNLAETVAWGFITRSHLASGAQRPQETIAFLRQALAVALEHDVWEPASVAYFSLSDRAFTADRYEEALGYLDQALATARRRGSRTGEWSTLAEQTYALYMLGRWDEVFEVAPEIPEERLLDAVTLSLLTSLLEMRLHRGELDEARRFRSLYGDLEQRSDVQERGCGLSSLAVLRRAEGDLEGALRLGVDAIEVARPAFGPGFQAVKQGTVEAVEAAIALGRADEADRLLREVEETLPGVRSPYLFAQAQRLRARLVDDAQAADELYTSAAAALRALSLPFWLAVAELEHAEWLSGEGRSAEAEPLARSAAASFERLAAGPWMERSGRLLAPAGASAVA
jgi:class 3 adenylate cyclase/tetratricopeptide (TPR) repeat protein